LEHDYGETHGKAYGETYGKTSGNTYEGTHMEKHPKHTLKSQKLVEITLFI